LKCGKWAAYCFSKEFSENTRNVSTNRKRGAALSCLRKSLAISKGFGVQDIKT
jgi:hypothetical protein